MGDGYECINRRLTGSVETSMSSLPPEILDTIIDHLRNEPATLKTCCLVSKSWVPRTRRHLFVQVYFNSPFASIELWKKTFPDPSNSPAHHTRTLYVHGPPVTTAAEKGAGGLIRTFRNVVHLELSKMDRASLVPFCGFSSTLRSLNLIHTPVDIFDLVCSFPLLEDLTLVALLPTGEVGGWNVPSTPPKLTGTLDLRMFGEAHHVARILLDLPGGLHFSEINAAFYDEDAKSVSDVVSRCSGTLERLTLTRQGAFRFSFCDRSAPHRRS